MKQKSWLSHFIRNECANQCEHCQVLMGMPCRYFERAVLGPPDYPYKTPGYNWPRVFAAYGAINPAFAGRGVVVRRCECGEILRARERICSKCRARHRRETYRKARAVQKDRCATVNGISASPNPLKQGVS